jgi:hypothetical protein
MASAEKALCDLCHLESGEWTEARMESMRFDPATIEIARRSGEPSRRLNILREYQQAAAIGSISPGT